MGDPFWKSGATLGFGSAPTDDIFADIFGSELYDVFWNHLVEPAKTVIEEIFYREQEGVMGAIPDWIRNHCFWDWLYATFGIGFDFFFPDFPTIVSWIIGFVPECFDVQMTLKWKFAMVYLIIFSWIAFFFLHIIRFITLIIYFILYWVFWIMSWIINLMLEIRLWIHLNIVVPIIQLLWPVIEFFIWLHW